MMTHGWLFVSIVLGFQFIAEGKVSVCVLKQV